MAYLFVYFEVNTIKNI